MKKPFTLGSLALVAISLTAAEKPQNEAFYVVGAMNQWTTPDQGGSHLKLTDEDGDGIYTGQFEIGAGEAEFKLFSEPEGWSSSNYYGYSSNIILLKDGTSLTLQPGWASNNITIGNWVPGTLSLAAEWVEEEGTWLPKLTLKGSNQPDEIVKPSTDAFYLVGDMNDWEMPSYAEADAWKYKLTDEDGDGVYAGSFEIPKGKVSFALFSKPDREWFSDSCYRLRYPDNSYLFAGEDLTFPLQNGMNAQTNITIDNWEGGEMEISVSWEPSAAIVWEPIITITGKNQPARPALPELYIIGNFNSWALPTVSSANGAIKVTDYISYTTSGIIESQQLDFEKQEVISFGICQFDSNTGNYSFFTPNENLPFTLYSAKANNNGDEFIRQGSRSMSGAWDTLNEKDKYSMTLKDWQGGKFGLRIDIPFDESRLSECLVYAEDTPFITKPESMYYILDSDGDKSCYNSSEFNLYDYVNASVSGKNVSIVLSSEESINPNPENCWGIEDSLEETGLDNNNTHTRISIVKGGKPLSWNFPDEGTLEISFDYLTSTAEINLSYVGGHFPADKIYVCGNVMTAPDGVSNNFLTPSAGNQYEYDEYWRLEETSPGVFTGTYYVYKDSDYTGVDALPQFRFFKDLSGWISETSLGSAESDFYCLPVLLKGDAVTYPIYPSGLGNWGPCTSISGEDYIWNGGWVKMIVDSNTGLLTLQKVVDSGVEGIHTESEDQESWYNLQGMKVDHPKNGMFIHIVNNKPRVEIVK